MILLCRKNNVLASPVKALISQLVGTLLFCHQEILVLIETSGACWCKQQSIVVVFTQNRCAGQTPLFTINRFLVQIHHLIMNEWLQINVWWIPVGSYLFMGHDCFW